MPLYEYACGTCGVVVEELQKHDSPPPACPNDDAHGQLDKLVSRHTGLALKGGGWASDGYEKKPKEKQTYG